MEFCPKCGCVLMNANKNAVCPRCKYRSKKKVVIESSENIEKQPRIGVLTDKDLDVAPTINAVCPKCKNKEAYFWTSQTRASDEAETRFFRCTKCKHTWREYK